MESILIVDDEKSIRDFLTIMLNKEGYETFVAGNGKAAIELLNERRFDLVITDLKMPDISGIEVLEEVKRLTPETQVIMITAFATAETAVEAMKKGAYEYIIKPFKVDEVKLLIKNALEKKRLWEENIYLRGELKEKYQFSNIIGKSENMSKVFDMVKKIASSSSTVLISGESGTGKELVARAIHYNSPRNNKPFMSINCGALPEQLLESELFGHQKGAFTSADSDKKGLFEVADKGSFLLDEIGEAPLSIQVKLLRVLQEREFKRVGGIKDIKVDVRVIAASNKNLSELVKQGKFREDLYYRLNVIPIEMPPLRQRVKDLPLLVNHFINKFNEITKKDIKGITAEALSILESHRWPGNVRELENVIERAMVLETSEFIQTQHLSDDVKVDGGISVSGDLKSAVSLLPADGVDLEAVIGNLEKDLVIKALNKTNGVMKKTADLLNINLRSLRYRMQKHSLKNSEFRKN